MCIRPHPHCPFTPCTRTYLPLLAMAVLTLISKSGTKSTTITPGTMVSKLDNSEGRKEIAMGLEWAQWVECLPYTLRTPGPM